MKRIKILGGLAAAALVVGVAPGAQANVPTVKFRSERTYVHCGDTKSAQADLITTGEVPTWNTTPPTASVQAGAGCGVAEVPGLVQTPRVPLLPGDPAGIDDGWDLVWEGTFTGNLDSMTVEPHAIWAGGARVMFEAGLSVMLVVDGQEVPLQLDDNDVQGVELIPVASSTGASSNFKFSITNLGFVEDPDLNDDGIADNEYGSIEHTVKLALNSYYIDQNPLMVWVWDTTEVPSGITFNPPVGADYRISRR